MPAPNSKDMRACELVQRTALPARVSCRGGGWRKALAKPAGPATIRRQCGRNSAVECQLPKLDVAGSNPVARFSANAFLDSPDVLFTLGDLGGRRRLFTGLGRGHVAEPWSVGRSSPPPTGQFFCDSSASSGHGCFASARGVPSHTVRGGSLPVTGNPSTRCPSALNFTEIPCRSRRFRGTG